MSKTKAVERPIMAGSDLAVLASITALAPAASILPIKTWPKFADWLGRAAQRLRPRAAGVLRTQLMRALPDIDGARAEAAGREAFAGPYLIRLHTARELIAPWAAPGADLAGAGHLERALAAGKGAILWVAHFAHNGLAVKKALNAAGFDIVHMSRPEHGFSKTSFGIHVLNPIRVAAEARYAKGRIIIRQHDYTTALRRAIRELRANGLISITAGAWEGYGFVEQPILNGRLKQATGPVKLARLTGATLIPAIGLWDGRQARYQTILLEPLQLDPGPDPVVQNRAAVERYLRAIEPHVREHPGQWRDWRKLIH